MSTPRPPLAGGRRLELHAHTHFSDGSLSPEELVGLARERSLMALAITDHDAVDAVEPAIEAAGDALEIIPGIEISSSLEGNDLHVLGYFIDWRAQALTERLASFREERRQRTRAIVERLRALGAEVSIEDVFAAAGPGVVGRPHIAQALLKAGHVPSIDAAFQRYLGSRGTAFVPRPSFPSTEAIAAIREAGGAAVLAHPATISHKLVESLAQAGLTGLEVWHPQHGTRVQRRWHEVARSLDLVATGGSDFHGAHRGVGLGDMPVPERVLGDLRERAAVPPRP